MACPVTSPASMVQASPPCCLPRSWGCAYDGATGSRCEIPTEMYCPNQCAGRGVCVYGFCKCLEGWHGTDCSVPTIAKLKDVTETPPEKGGWHTQSQCWVWVCCHAVLLRSACVDALQACRSCAELLAQWHCCWLAGVLQSQQQPEPVPLLHCTTHQALAGPGTRP